MQNHNKRLLVVRQETRYHTHTIIVTVLVVVLGEGKKEAKSHSVEFVWLVLVLFLCNQAPFVSTVSPLNQKCSKRQREAYVRKRIKLGK